MTEMVARLKPGATVGQARNEVAAITARVQRENPEAYNATRHHRVSVIPFREVMGERARQTLYLLMGAAVFVLIISAVSAASVANLTLMRGVRREHELAVRAALGSGVARLRRLLLVENVLLALAGAAVGIVIALGGVRMLTAFAERYSPRASEIALDGVVLTFTLVLSGAVALLLSFMASVPQERGLSSWVLAGTKRMSAGVSRQRLQRALVVLQIAVSVVLLAGAGLLTRTMLQLSDVRTGLRVATTASSKRPTRSVTRSRRCREWWTWGSGRRCRCAAPRCASTSRWKVAPTMQVTRCRARKCASQTPTSSAPRASRSCGDGPSRQRTVRVPGTSS
jgi:hypothetical protein